MERLLVLRLEAVACSAEAQLNGVPLARVDAARPTRTLPVHEFTLAGVNQLELVVQPVLPGAPELSTPHLADGKAWAGVRLLLPRSGQVAHPSNARTLAQIDWAAPDGELYEAPLHLAQTVDLNIAFPRWRWLDAPLADDVAAAKAQASRLLQRLAVSLARGDPEPFLSAARLRFEELALAYQRNLADEAGRWRVMVQALGSGGPFKPDLTPLAGLQLRKVAGGRLLECLAADGQPALRGSSADGALRQWPLRVALIEGGLHVLR
jgi:hypothetical protein